MTAIEFDGLTKRYGSVEAITNVSLSVEEGEIFGFLGPNGAGKSTVIGLMLDFIRPTAGRIEVLGHDANSESLAVRKRTGVLPDGYHVYDRLSGRKHVEFAIRSKDASDDADALLERVGILDAADRKAGTYSKGMTQRLMLATALVGEPDLLVFDEPTTGLDPSGARVIRDVIREERDRGATVFFSSHLLHQVEAVCDRVGILNRGELVALDSVAGLRERTGAGTRLRIQVDRTPEDALAAVRDRPGVTGVTVEDGSIVVQCQTDSLADVVTTLDGHGIEISDFATEVTSLEDLFIGYTSAGDTPSAPEELA